MGRVIAKRALQRHPDSQSPAIEIATKTMLIGRDVLRLEFHLSGEIDRLRLPQRTVEQRADRLWDHSCFEAFLADGDGEGYTEVNLSPSSEWATYRFDGYRAGMQIAWLAPYPHTERSAGWLSVIAYCEFGVLDPRPSRLGLSAVIEATDGTKSYWALRHPPGPPDFHHPDCFALTLPPPDAP